MARTDIVVACMLAAGCGRMRFEPLTGDAVEASPTQTLYIAGGSTIAAYRPDLTTGEPMPVPGSPFSSKVTELTGLAIDATGRFVVASGTGAISLASYAIDPSTGALAEIADTDFTIQLQSVVSHPSLPAFYSTGTTCTAYQFDLDLVTGKLALASMANVIVPCSPLFASVDPKGRWIFLPGAGSTFGIDVGQLDAAGHILAFNRSGRAGAVSVASVSDPSGRYLFIADNGASGIFGFPIDQTTGAVGMVGVMGTPAFPGWSDQQAIAFDPSGTSLYVFDGSDGAYHFTFDASTGGIAAVPATANPANAGGDSGLVSTAFSRDGHILYGVDGRVGIHAFTVDPASGMLTSLPGSPFATAGVASAIVITK